MSLAKRIRGSFSHDSPAGPPPADVDASHPMLRLDFGNNRSPPKMEAPAVARLKKQDKKDNKLKNRVSCSHLLQAFASPANLELARRRCRLPSATLARRPNRHLLPRTTGSRRLAIPMSSLSTILRIRISTPRLPTSLRISNSNSSTVSSRLEASPFLPPARPTTSSAPTRRPTARVPA